MLLQQRLLPHGGRHLLALALHVHYENRPSACPPWPTPDPAPVRWVRVCGGQLGVVQWGLSGCVGCTG
jgi:hypothetical protein